MSRELDPVGLVQVGGERWTAVSDIGGEKIDRDAQVKVVQVDGLRLKVRKIEE